jgi:hypothetical protein
LLEDFAAEDVCPLAQLIEPFGPTTDLKSGNEKYRSKEVMNYQFYKWYILRWDKYTKLICLLEDLFGSLLYGIQLVQ